VSIGESFRDAQKHGEPRLQGVVLATASRFLRRRAPIPEDPFAQTLTTFLRIDMEKGLVRQSCVQNLHDMGVVELSSAAETIGQ
jgi:hypothetical protein